MNKTHLILAMYLRKWIKKVKIVFLSHSELVWLGPIFGLTTGISEAY